LKHLYCYDCTSLTEIPLIEGLKWLYCVGCTSLTEIPVIEGLKYLWCKGCTSLTEIPLIEGLKYIRCSGCTSLTEIQVIEGLEVLDCSGCEWVNQNPKYNENIRKLITLQMFCRKNIPYFRFKKWINTREFSEWFYHPDNLGGSKHKKNMMKMLRDQPH
jgi:hypothetical protein